MFSLTVAYPKVDSRFYIAWKVPSRRALTPQGEAFLAKVRTGNLNFSQSFGDRLLASVLPKPIAYNCSIALYADARNQKVQHPELELISWWIPNPDRYNGPEPQKSLILNSEKMFLTQAWWGAFAIAAAKKPESLDSVETAAGFLAGEKI